MLLDVPCLFDRFQRPSPLPPRGAAPRPHARIVIQSRIVREEAELCPMILGDCDARPLQRPRLGSGP